MHFATMQAWYPVPTTIKERHVPGKTILIAVLLGGLCCGAAAAGGSDHAVPVRKTAEDFQQNAWTPDLWSSVKGQTSLIPTKGDSPIFVERKLGQSPERKLGQSPADAKTARCLTIDVAFSGAGFEHFTAAPPAPLWIPGDAKTVTLRYKISDRRYALKMGFVDGWGRDQVNGTYLSWDIHADPSDDWKNATFKVPDAWIRPVRIGGITTHNWEARNAKNKIRIQVGEIEVETDIQGVDPKTGVLATWTPEPNPAKP